MATLNYNILSENKYLKMTLMEEELRKIDEMTTRFLNKNQLIHDVIYDDLIGMYIYDNEDLISDIDALNDYLTIEYTPTKEDRAILARLVNYFRYCDVFEIKPIFQQEKAKMKDEILFESILKNNKKIYKGLKELHYFNSYYLYLRIIDSYYNQEELEKESYKNLVLK